MTSVETLPNNEITIFDEQTARKPDRYPWVQDFINSMWNGHWTPNEFSFQSDIQDFKVNFSPEEKEIVQKTLSAIGQIEIAVKKFWAKLGDNLPHPSLSDLGFVMAGVEVIHNKAYEKLLDVLELQQLFEDNLKLDIIKNRVGYLKKHLDKVYKDEKQQYIYSLILFTLFVENVSLFSQFYVILWFNRYKNALKDTSQQVLYTKNEELIHAQVGIKLIQTIQQEFPELFDNELKQKIAYEAKQAFKYESQIIDWIIGDYEGININADILKEYVKNRINSSLGQIGFDKLFDINEELIEKTQWMNEEVLGTSSVDFFHKRPVDYSKKNQSFSVEDIF